MLNLNLARRTVKCVNRGRRKVKKFERQAMNAAVVKTFTKIA